MLQANVTNEDKRRNAFLGMRRYFLVINLMMFVDNTYIRIHGVLAITVVPFTLSPVIPGSMPLTLPRSVSICALGTHTDVARENFQVPEQESLS